VIKLSLLAIIAIVGLITLIIKFKYSRPAKLRKLEKQLTRKREDLKLVTAKLAIAIKQKNRTMRDKLDACRLSLRHEIDSLQRRYDNLKRPLS
jgi:hypothetical protein